jgi:hypothetical protein
MPPLAVARHASLDSSRERSRVFSVQRDARALKLDIECRAQAGVLYRAAPERFGDVGAAWLERYVVGAAGRVRPRPKSVRVVEDCLGYLSPLNDLPVERIRRPQVEDLIATLAARAPRRPGCPSTWPGSCQSRS